MSFKASDVLRFLAAVAAVVAVGAVVVWRVTSSGPAGPPAAQPPARASVKIEACGAPAWADAAAANRSSLETLRWSPFGAPETGWVTYAPQVAREIATDCPPVSPGFAAAYAKWQASQHLVSDGVFKAADFARLRNILALRRPFVQLTAKGVCPPPPDPGRLAAAEPEEGYGRKIVFLRNGALAAYRRMVAAARAAGVARDPDDFKLISGFRGPEEERARCAAGGCNTVSKAACSAHRTGLALDVYLGRAAGFDPVSSSEENRRAIARTPAYRWLAANADRYGFLNYPYEPWHWEWTGEPP